jgi:hypothetical protein
MSFLRIQQQLDPRRPFPLELKSVFIKRFCDLWNVRLTYKSALRRRLVACNRWNEEINGSKDSKGFVISAPKACVRVLLANGDEYFVRDEDNMWRVNFEDVHQSARGAFRDGDDF